MNLLELVLMQSCNYKCPDCPMAKWLYKPDENDDNGHPRNGITKDSLFKWVDKYINPDWFVRLNGGEPTLHPECFDIMKEFSKRGIKGLIQSNGSNEIPEVDGWKRVCAWHKDKPFPKSYDYILILENPNDDWKEKEKHCINNNIPHVVFPYTNFGSDWKSTTYYPPKPNKLFQKMTTIFSSGALSTCFVGQAELKEGSIFDMSEPKECEFCRICCNIEAIEYYIWNIPGFYDQVVTDVSMLRSDPFYSLPYLSMDNKWLDEEGKEWGVLGDDVNEINKNYVKEKEEIAIKIVEDKHRLKLEAENEKTT